MDGIPIQCGDCGAHYQLDPSGDVQGAACEGCGGKRFFRNQPSPTESDGDLRDMPDIHDPLPGQDTGGNPLAEGTIMGDGEKPMGKRDNYMHSKVADRKLQRVEPMNTLNMEPYEPLWHESYAKEAGAAAELAAPLMEGAGAGGGLGRMMPMALPSLMRGVMGQGTGQQAGSEAPEAPTPAPSIEQVSSVADIPAILAAMDTPHSVKSVGEQHDDPEDQDQKEFNDGDMSPSNMQNPNLEDSGKSGEQADQQPGNEFSPNSPGVERAMMILPLLLHYFESDESGHADPLIRGLHEALDQEKPGYLDDENPEGQHIVEMIMQQHKTPHGVHAGVNAFPSGLPTMPGTGMDTAQQTGAQGNCPTCGAPLAADGSCPNCGASQSNNPMGGMPGAAGGGTIPGASMPPNAFTGNAQGPVTPEQQQAMVQALRGMGMANMVPDMLQNPTDWGWLLNQIQKQPNTPPLVDPSQAQQQPPPAPMPGMGGPGMPGAPGSMPVVDPTQPGGGGGQPMQPMASRNDPFWMQMDMDPDTEHFHHWNPTDGASFDQSPCPQCHQAAVSGVTGTCQSCGYKVPRDSGDVGMNTLGDQPGLQHSEMPDLGPTHWGKTANVRCPNCESGSTEPRVGTSEDTTSWECHGCGHIWSPDGLDLSKGARLNIDSRLALVDMVNPTLENAAEQHEVRHDEGRDPSQTWIDAHGQPIELGQVYELHTAGVPTPDEVKVISRKPDELGLKMVGMFSNVSNGMDRPDFTITPDQLQSGQYSLTASGPNDSPEQPLGGMPGLEQIPQSGPTTDESASSYPNDGTLSHTYSDDLCHKCGGDWIDHVASSPTAMMHECARCGAVWETKDEDYGHTSNTDLSWLYDSSGQDDFWSGMERAQEMRNSGPSRSLTAALSKDDRYQRIHNALESNGQARTSKLAGRHFTPSEQRELVNERGTARNADLLDLTGTHYTTSHGFDPRDPRGRANEMNVPDGHLVLGL